MAGWKKRFYLVDDHPIFVEALSLVIQSNPQWELVGASSLPQDALGEILALSPDLVLVDAAMPGLPGPDLVRLLRARGFAGKVIALSSMGDQKTVLDMFAAGANAYVLKSGSVSGLVEAVDAVSRSRTWFSPELSDLVMQAALGREPPKEGARLTERERLVLSLLMADRAPKEIAHLMGISRKTVDNHKAHLMKKLGVSSHTALILKAGETGLCVP